MYIYQILSDPCNILLPQVVIFPPGRKRRSIADWLLQVLNLPSVKGAKTPAATPPTVSKGGWCGAAEAATVALQLFDSWVQVLVFPLPELI